MRALLAVFAAVQVVTGALLWLAPGFFHDEIGPYGARNDHYMGDLATWYLALGAAAFVAVRRTSWRVPVLALAFIQYALHSINHLIDVGDADPGWLGPANLVSLLLATLLLGWMLLPQLIAAGHEVTGTTRTEQGAEAIRTAGARAAVCDALDAGALYAAVTEAAPEVVVHQLTALPHRFDPRDKEIYAPTNRLRSEATRTLLDAARAAGARRLICQSIAFAYAPGRQAEVKDEDAPLALGAPPPFGDGVRAIDEMERAVVGAEGLEGLVLRYGWFYGPGTYY